MESLNPHRPYPTVDPPTATDEAAAVWTLRSSSEAVRAVRYAADSGLTIRLVGDPKSESQNSIVVAMAIDGPVRVDPITRTARIPAGTPWTEVEQEVAAHDLAFFDDDHIVSRLLGGSPTSHDSGRGAAAVSIAAVTMVLADARVVTVTTGKDPETLWALRDGAVSLGLVTEVTVALRLPHRGGAVPGAGTRVETDRSVESIRGRLAPHGMFDASHYSTWRSLELTPATRTELSNIRTGL